MCTSSIAWKGSLQTFSWYSMTLGFLEEDHIFWVKPWQVNNRKKTVFWYVCYQQIGTAIITKISSSSIQYVSCCEVRRVLAYGKNLEHRSQQQLPKERRTPRTFQGKWLPFSGRSMDPKASIAHEDPQLRSFRQNPPNVEEDILTLPSIMMQTMGIPPIVSSLSNAANFHRTIMVERVTQVASSPSQWKKPNPWCFFSRDI